MYRISCVLCAVAYSSTRLSASMSDLIYGLPTTPPPPPPGGGRRQYDLFRHNPAANSFLPLARARCETSAPGHPQVSSVYQSLRVCPAAAGARTLCGADGSKSRFCRRRLPRPHNRCLEPPSREINSDLLQTGDFGAGSAAQRFSGTCPTPQRQLRNKVAQRWSVTRCCARRHGLISSVVTQ